MSAPVGLAHRVLQNERERDPRRKRPSQMKPQYAQASATSSDERWPHVAKPKAPWNRLGDRMTLSVCESVRAFLAGDVEAMKKP